MLSTLAVDEVGSVVKAVKGTVDEPCTTRPLDPMLTTTPFDKVAAGPPRETMVPSIVATFVAPAASYAVTGVPLAVKTTADGAADTTAADAPFTNTVPPEELVVGSRQKS